MKISQDSHLNLDKSRTDLKQNTPMNGKFQQIVLRQNQQMQVEALTRLLGDIDGVGKRLSKSRTFKDLSRFKSLIKRFVKEAVDYGMELSHSQTWNQYGQSRSLTIVDTIDEKLAELAKEIMETEKSSLDILAKIGEIKGLLINLYT